MIDAVNREIKFGSNINQSAHANFIMTQEYYDFIEFLQNELGFEEVNELQKKFGGAFYNPEYDN
jgi:hypothetical protein